MTIKLNHSGYHCASPAPAESWHMQGQHEENTNAFIISIYIYRTSYSEEQPLVILKVTNNI